MTKRKAPVTNTQLSQYPGDDVAQVARRDWNDRQYFTLQYQNSEGSVIQDWAGARGIIIKAEHNMTPSTGSPYSDITIKVGGDQKEFVEAAIQANERWEALCSDRCPIFEFSGADVKPMFSILPDQYADDGSQCVFLNSRIYHRAPKRSAGYVRVFSRGENGKEKEMAIGDLEKYCWVNFNGMKLDECSLVNGTLYMSVKPRFIEIVEEDEMAAAGRDRFKQTHVQKRVKKGATGIKASEWLKRKN